MPSQYYWYSTTNEVISRTDNSSATLSKGESLKGSLILNYGQLILFYDVYFSDTTRSLFRIYFDTKLTRKPTTPLAYDV